MSGAALDSHYCNTVRTPSLNQHWHAIWGSTSDDIGMEVRADAICSAAARTYMFTNIVMFVNIFLITELYNHGTN
jgi:hypothetical protein